MEKLEHPSQLVKKINEKKCAICIIGLGQVGLPTALSFLKLGYKVFGYDVNKKLVQNVLQGISHIPEVGFGELITKFINNNSFRVSSVANILSNADVVVVCVATLF